MSSISTYDKVIEDIKQICEILDELDSLHEEMPNMLSNCDLRLSDLYHYLESNSFTSKSSYRFCREFKKVLEERRNIKYTNALLNTFNNEKDRLNLQRNRQMLLADLMKEFRKVSGSYTNKVYGEEELLEIIRGEEK